MTEFKFEDFPVAQQIGMQLLAKSYPISRWIPDGIDDALIQAGLIDYAPRWGYYELTAAGRKMMGIADAH